MPGYEGASNKISSVSFFGSFPLKESGPECQAKRKPVNSLDSRYHVVTLGTHQNNFHITFFYVSLSLIVLRHMLHSIHRI